MKNEKRIEILPDYIANQIAAGEVVQRPESAVKELVENSLDAGADTIVVVVKNSGKSQVHIVDNGHGMRKEDMLLSVRRHATSKINSSEDLAAIKTYGFRGEALASICSVANVEIRSKHIDSNEDFGWQLISEPNKDPIMNPISCNVGTQVFMRNLFFNTPARRKFLRADLTEFRYISDTMQSLALAHPSKRFTFYDNNSLIFDVHAESLKQRINSVLGLGSEAMIKVDYKNDMLEINGYVGSPTYAKKSRPVQYLFLNSRPIKSASIAHAVFSAFEHLLEKKQKPFFVLNIIIDHKSVDVNVHPQKHEVKFDDERFIYSCFRTAVHKSLQSKDLTPSLPTKNYYDDGLEAHASDVALVDRSTGEILNKKPSQNFQTPKQRNIDYQKKPEPIDNKKVTAYEELFKSEFEKPIERQPEKIEGEYWQLHEKYIFMQTKNGVRIIDQHNAHERVIYERTIDRMQKGFAKSQDLLFPVVIKLSSSQISLMKELAQEIDTIGFKYEFTENNEIKIVAVPQDVRQGMEERVLAEVLQDYADNSELQKLPSRDRLAASFACKSAIKTGEKLSNEEVEALARDIMNCRMPYVCPHGRPIIIDMTLKELDKNFGRTS